MAADRSQIAVGLEIGKKRVFACPLDWPGWCRSGKDEESAIEAVLKYASRYQAVLQPGGIDFPEPKAISDLVVVERQSGTTTTDFGAPDIIFTNDQRPVDQADAQQLMEILQVCWRAFDRAEEAAAGKELRKGPRGGGREVEAIFEHVLNADLAYLSRLGWKAKIDRGITEVEAYAKAHQAILDGLQAAARGELPERGPRGGKIWPARYFVRRSAWHILDHAWEIEDRL